MQIGAETVKKGTLKSIFSTCDLASEQVSRAVDQYDERVGLSHAFWNRVEGDPSVGTEVVTELQLTLKLGELTMGHLPLLRELQRLRQEGLITHPEDLLDQDWMSLITARVEGQIIGTPPGIPGETEDERVNNYAEALRLRVPRLFPSAVIARRVRTLRQERMPEELRGGLFIDAAVVAAAAQSEAGEDEEIPGAPPPEEESSATLERLSQFFGQNPAFDLSSTPIGRTLDVDTPEEVRSLRRLLKITPHDPGASADLLLDGVNSAHDVACMGRGNFLAQHGPGLGHQAKSIHASAVQQSLMALALYARCSPGLNPVAPAMTPSPITPPNIPEWAGLFGTLNLCDIVDDRSVLSAGAYLVDVLHFLGQQKLKFNEKGKSALKVLLERRPDIAWLELSSPNTHTMLPYVDLVNEVLEAAVFPLQFQIEAGSEDELDKGVIPERLKEQFEKIGHHLTGDARVLVKDKGSKWSIADSSWMFEIDLGFGALDVSASVAYQTAATADELAANPEYLIAKVYDRLASEEVYPWNLPFDLWAEAARLYLKHLGLPRYQLMEKFGPITKREVSVATEYLGMTEKERGIITDGDINSKPWQYWDLEEKGNELPDPDYPRNTVELEWHQALGRVPVFLERSGMDYEQLTELLAAKFINSQGSSQVKFPCPSETESAIGSACDLDRAQITNLDAVLLNKIHRFVRLQRKTGWSIPELDQVVRVLEKVDLGEDLIIAARHLRQLQADLRVPLGELLSWYANIDTVATVEDTPSFYERLFLNKTVLRPVNEHFALNQDRTDLAVNDRPINDGASTILAALSIDAAELESILDAEFPPPGEPPKLNLENLSRIQRIVSLSRALKLSVRELLSLRAMIGIDPFDRKDMAATQRFIETVRAVRASGFGIAELDYLLRHRHDEARDHFVPTDGEIARVLADIGNGLGNINEEFADADDPTGELTGKRLAQLLEPTEAQQVIDVLSKSANDGAPPALPNGLAKRLESAVPGLVAILEQAPGDKPPELRFQEVLKQVNNDLNQTSSAALVAQRLGSALHLDADVIDLLLNKPVNGGPPMQGDFLALKSGGLSRDGADGRWSGMVQAEKSGCYVFTPGKNGITLKIGNREITSGNKSTTLDAEAGAFYNIDLGCDSEKPPSLIWSTPSAPEDQQEVPANRLVPARAIRTFRRLHKLSLLVSKLRIGANELNYLAEHKAHFQGFDWNQLPLEPTRDAPLFAHWQQLYNLFTFRDRYAQAETRLVDVLAAAHQSSEAAREQLLALTGWDEQDLNELVGQKGLSLTDGDYQGGGRFEELHQAFVLLKRLGTSAGQLLDWAATDRAVLPLAQSLKQAVKAKYDEQQWLEVAKPLEDTLREKRRAALVAYHIVKAGLRDAHGLYQHYLLDVEMSPCMMTSRTVLAISSVQLFVQRCLMNLEAWRIAFPQQALEWKRLWEWMKNYRVWEANRKIFLYPENWIEPELRRDKTPFFKELENELLSDEMTAGLADSAFLNYLDKLDAVARLEICGLYHEVETNEPKGKGITTVDVLHVFGRTRCVPKVYYYRRRAHGAWTAWEQVHLDIEGDHLIPVVFNRRLYLFWPIFAEKTEALKDKDGQAIKDDQGKQKTRDSWEVQLAFSEYRQGMWSAKKISDQRLTWDRAPKDDDARKAFEELKSKNWEGHPCEPQNKSDLTFKTHIANEVLYVLCALRKPEDNAYPYQGGFRFTSDAQVDTLSEEGLVFLGKAYPVSSPAQGGAYENMAIKAGGELSFNTNGGAQVLAESPSPFTLILPHQLPQEAWQNCFFYQDADRVLFVERYPNGGPTPRASSEERAGQEAPAGAVSVDAALSVTSFPVETPPYLAGVMTSPPGADGADNKYRFENAYHPLVHEFIKRLKRDGIDGLLHRPVQQLCREPLLFWTGEYESRWFQENKPDQVKRVFMEHGILLSSAPGVEKVKVEEGDFDRWRISGKLSDTKQDWTCYVERVPEGLYAYRDFAQQYAPSGAVKEPYPAGVADFDAGSFYSQYNWELFFHAPLMIADRLSKNQRFEAAQQWFHRIFDPTDTSAYKPPERYWQTLPFFQEATGEPIQDLLALLGYRGDDQEQQGARRRLEQQLEQWQQDPFEPHLIARLRLGAYQKTVVMKYIDNLIAWGDQLFRRDTIETINEATQLYILAAEILGKHPVIIPPPWETPPQTFEVMRKELDAFSSGHIRLEERLPAPGTPPLPQDKGAEAVLGSSLTAPYFGVPRNDKLLSYWDTVADRLFKIRHCLNIEGVERRLPLFQPPIEPGLLVRARAAGVDISSVLSDIGAPLPHFRFPVMLEKALEFCNDVKSLGAAFLCALEKKDAEGLAQLKMRQDGPDMRFVKEEQIKAAKESLASLEKAKEIAEAREAHLSSGGGLPVSAVTALVPGAVALWNAGKGTLGRRGEAKQLEEKREKQEATHKEASLTEPWSGGGQQMAATMYSLAATSTAIPTMIMGGAGISSPVSLVVSGGQQVQSKSELMAKWFEALVEVGKSVAAAIAAHQEVESQKAEVEYKRKLEVLEIESIEKQMAAAEIGVAIAEQELKNLEQEIKNAEEVDTYLRNKFTNLELYNWRVAQLSSLYFQSYQLAYDLAKRAEKAFHYELGGDDTRYIQFGYWDSLKKGLLAGEKLGYDLRRMEAAYLEQNRRDYEITKHISLAGYYPEQLRELKLKAKGECSLDLSEILFDLDYPGHYLRRIKSVGLSVDCEAGPYTSINCTLTLTGSTVRKQATLTNGKYERGDGDDPRFQDRVGVTQSIATSGARNDSGLFELNFRDDRYLPFEGAGAISRWRIELPQDCNQIDTGAISDVVLHLRYTAREGGKSLREAAKKAVNDEISKHTFGRLIGVKEEFAPAWADFLSQPGDAGKHVLNLPLTASLFPAMFRGKIKISAAWLCLSLKDECEAAQGFSLPFTLKPSGGGQGNGEFKPTDGSGLACAEIKNLDVPPGAWQLTVEEANATPLQSVENMLIWIVYKVVEERSQNFAQKAI